MEEEKWRYLQSRQTLREHPFHSNVPLLGPLIAWFRECWNSVSTRWYVRALIEQQNAFNAAVVAHLRTYEDRLLNLQAQIDVLKQTTDSEGLNLQAQIDVLKQTTDSEGLNLQAQIDVLKQTTDSEGLNLQAQIDVLKQTTDSEGWLIQQDRQQTALIHDLAELTTQLALKSRALSDLEQRLAHLEGTQPPAQEAV